MKYFYLRTLTVLDVLSDNVCQPRKTAFERLLKVALYCAFDHSEIRLLSHLDEKL